MVLQMLEMGKVFPKSFLRPLADLINEKGPLGIPKEP